MFILYAPHRSAVASSIMSCETRCQRLAFFATGRNRDALEPPLVLALSSTALMGRGFAALRRRSLEEDGRGNNDDDDDDDDDDDAPSAPPRTKC